jgi:hypothetical protein
MGRPTDISPSKNDKVVKKTKTSVAPGTKEAGTKQQEKKKKKKKGLKGAKGPVELKNSLGQLVDADGRRIRKNGKMWRAHTPYMYAAMRMRKAMGRESVNILFTRTSVSRCLRACLEDEYMGMRVGKGVVDAIACAMQADLVRRTQRSANVMIRGTAHWCRPRSLTGDLYDAVNVSDDALHHI